MIAFSLRNYSCEDGRIQPVRYPDHKGAIGTGSSPAPPMVGRRHIMQISLYCTINISRHSRGDFTCGQNPLFLAYTSNVYYGLSVAGSRLYFYALRASLPTILFLPLVLRCKKSLPRPGEALFLGFYQEQRSMMTCAKISAPISSSSTTAYSSGPCMWLSVSGRQQPKATPFARRWQ